MRQSQYISVGPNFCWHPDGYDNLKPYGIRGFSRKILLLKVSRTNNDSIVPAYFYTETVKKIGFRPKYLRTISAESGIIAGI